MEEHRESLHLPQNPSANVSLNRSKSADNISNVYRLDARQLDSILDPCSVDVTVTSPPYFDLKDYGHPDQIGFGQTYESYLEDLATVFSKVFTVTKDTGSLWVVIDMFRKGGEVIPLPFDFVNRMKEIGWKLREVIVWEKDRTVPWAHKGQVRNSFEYILVLSKTQDYKFFIERVKTTDSLKKWWIRYPERYNPRGKSPEAIWHFPIPTQGSWGKGYIRHFCPLPEDLITQILTIASDKGDIVLDPFAGSGAVLSRAANMERHYIGFELNESYIKMFNDYLKATGTQKQSNYLAIKRLNQRQSDFERLIRNLRTLKFARLLFNSLKTANYFPLRIMTSRGEESSDERFKLIKAKYHIYVNSCGEIECLNKFLTDLITKPPYSKFGIEAQFVLHNTLPSFLRAIEGKRLYTYTPKNTHFFKRKFSIQNLKAPTTDEVIVSEIRLEIDESEFSD